MIWALYFKRVNPLRVSLKTSAQGPVRVREYDKSNVNGCEGPQWLRTSWTL